MVFISVKIYGQCTYISSWGGGTLNSATPGTSVTLSTCNFGGEYSPATFNVIGAFTFSSSVPTDYITITDASNNILIFGPQPLAATIPSMGLYWVHFAAAGPPACTTDNNCRTTSIFVPLLPCAGTPTAGTVPASFSICPNTSAAITASNATAASGITYQWMEAPSATGPWTNVTTGSGFNTQVLTTASLTSQTFYQLVITCTNSSQSATTAVTSVNPNNPPTLCYCNTNLGGSGCTGDHITNVSILNTPLNNNSTCNNTPLNGTYSQFNPGPTTTATLNIGITYTISVTTTQNNIESVWIDYNQSGTFDVNEHTQICLSSTPNVATLATFTVPGTALLGQTGMRIRSRGTGNPNGSGDACSNFGSGETEDYIVTIAAATPCAGAPGANSAVASLTSVCPNGSVTLGLANSYTVGGLTYQWYSAPAVSGPFTSISGATTAVHTATNLTANTFFNVVITCTNGPASTTATAVQVMVSGNPCQCASYCNTSQASSTGDDEIFNVNIGTLNNTSNCSQTGGPGSILNRYSNYTGMIAAPNLTVANNYTLNVTVGQCGSGSYNGGVTVYIDYNQNGSFADAGEKVFVGPSTLWAIAGTLNTTVITIPASATPGITRMRVIAVEGLVNAGDCAGYTWGETEDYCVNIAAGTPCAGAPGANSAVASQTNVCPGGSSNLSLATSYTVGGLTYQWFTSPTVSGPYTAVSGATTSVYSFTNITSALYYQAVITCTNGPASTTSTPVQVLVGGSPCQCASYCNTSLASSTGDDEIFNVNIGTLNNTSNCSQTGGPGSILNRYSNYAGLIAAPNLTVANNYTLNVTVGQCGSGAYNGGVTVYIDYNHNGSFADPGEQVFVGPSTLWAIAGTLNTTVITIPASATPGITRMRVIAVEGLVGAGDCAGYTWGETEDYCVNIAPGTPCAGTPAANSAVASQTNVCPGGSSNLGLATSYTLGGLTYQWYTSPTVSGPYTSVSSATTSAYTFTNITSSLYYQVVITCTNGPASTTSTPVQVLVGGTPCQCAAYCTSSANSTNDDEIFNVSIGSLNNTSSCSQTGGPGSILNRYSNYAGVLAAPTLSAALNYTLSVTVGQCNSFAYSGVITTYMDFNQNGSFADAGELVYTSPYSQWAIAGTTFTTVVQIPANATLGTTRMRVVAGEGTTAQPDCGTYGWGETEDYCINIAPPTPCTGAPSSNSSVASVTAVCSGGTSTLNIANSYTVGGLSYQWQTSPTISGPYTSVSGATSTPYAFTNITTGLFYQVVITCSSSPVSTTATPIQVAILGAPVYAPIPFLENFDNTWQNRCDNHNVPVAANWDSNPTTGDESWRRQDDGATAMWSSNTFTQAPLTGAGCADFHSWDNFQQGDLMLYVNLSTAATPTLSFYHVNVFGDDSLGVYLSTDGGTTYSYQGSYVSGDYSPVDANWNQKTLVLNSLSSPTCVIKFTGYGDFTDDIGIDSLQIKTSCAAPNVSLTASQTTVCSGNAVTLTASGATTYTWNTSAQTSSISVTPLTTTSYTVVGENTPGCPTTKTINIVVNPSPTVSVAANPGFTLCPGFTTTLTATSSANNYTWNPGNITTAAISVTPAISTVYNVATTNSLGCTTNSNVTVFVVVCTGIAKNTIIDNNTFVYPNPNSGNINVVIQDASGNYSFEILDLAGRVVYKTTLSKVENALSIKELANGMYTYKITSLTSKTAIKEGKLIKE